MKFSLLFSILHCLSPVLLLSIQRKTWSSFLNSLAEWVQNSNFITITGSWLDLEGSKYSPLEALYRNYFLDIWISRKKPKIVAITKNLTNKPKCRQEPNLTEQNNWSKSLEASEVNDLTSLMAIFFVAFSIFSHSEAHYYYLLKIKSHEIRCWLGRCT